MMSPHEKRRHPLPLKRAKSPGSPARPGSPAPSPSYAMHGNATVPKAFLTSRVEQDVETTTISMKTGKPIPGFINIKSTIS